ncbi:MAG: prepilin peptidase [Lentisphaeria bacterium]|nr:prepilin peptidase [Lentisphaeria bacterium]
MPTESSISLTPLFLLFAFAFGCIVGSFLNVVVWRLPRGESLSHPPSHCPNCGHAIRAWENVPILSWLALRGRCSACSQRISWRYPLGEFSLGLLYAALAWNVWRNQLPLALLPGFFWLTASLLAAAQIDLKHRIIPDKLNYAGMLVALLLSLLLPGSRLLSQELPPSMRAGIITDAALDWLAALCAKTSPWNWRFEALLDLLLGLLLAAACLLIFHSLGKLLLRFRAESRQAIGLGDVKCIAMIGAFLGADAGIYILLGAASLGFVAGTVQILWSRKKTGFFSELPFAPFLALPTIFWLIKGNWLYFIYQAIMK